MSVITPLETDGYIHFDEDACAAAGAALADRYRAAEPFPHIVMDDFLPPDFLRGMLDGFPANAGMSYFDRSQERLKFQFPPAAIPGRRLRNFVTELNSVAIVRFLEQLTGISRLIPDPYYRGGGLHETLRGGHLGIHADFNLHHELGCERRLNLLIYLNDDWSPAYKGDLELWDREMKACRQTVAPLIGRAVVFNTTLGSFHGHPDPLACPPERSRRSVATYYYTAPAGGMLTLPDRTTVFRPRPATPDRPDRRVQLDHVLKDWLPPRLYRFATRFNRFS
ncbi:MAG TPA: 2OG-Fe(II) oxygenase [Novosphingobium sp.]